MKTKDLNKIIELINNISVLDTKKFETQFKETEIYDNLKFEIENKFKDGITDGLISGIKLTIAPYIKEKDIEEVISKVTETAKNIIEDYWT
jgi:hypothetical protein